MKNCMPSSARYGLPTTVGFNGHDIRKTRMPAYSFGARFPNSEKVESPGPNAYALPTTLGGRDRTVERAPAHTIHSKFGTKDHLCSPGPNSYGLMNFKPGQRAPCYSLGAKIPELFQTQEC